MGFFYIHISTQLTEKMRIRTIRINEVRFWILEHKHICTKHLMANYLSLFVNHISLAFIHIANAC